MTMIFARAEKGKTMNDLISREETAKRLEALAEQRKGSFSGEAFEFAAKVVRGVPTAVQWIPVSERLPEKDGYYLVYCAEYDGICIIYYEILKTKSKWRTKWKEVTHWMPLPEPPKGTDDR